MCAKINNYFAKFIIDKSLLVIIVFKITISLQKLLNGEMFHFTFTPFK